MDVSITELRANLKANLARVQAGETLTITDHGRPVALLVPADEADRIANLEAAGIIDPPASSERTRSDQVRRVQLAGDGLASDLISEMRD